MMMIIMMILLPGPSARSCIPPLHKSRIAPDHDYYVWYDDFDDEYDYPYVQ